MFLYKYFFIKIQPKKYTKANREFYGTLSKYMHFKINYDTKNFKQEVVSQSLRSLLLGKSDIFVHYIQSGSRHINLSPIFDFYYQLYMTIPINDSVSSSYFIELFHSTLWFAILAIYCTIIGFLLMYKYFHKLRVNQYIESIFHVIGVSSEQIKFSTISYRICVIIATILLFLLGNYFGAFLTTQLSIKSEKNLPFERIEDLTTQTKYKICIFPIASNAVKSMTTDKIYNHILNGPECTKIEGFWYNDTYSDTLEWFYNSPHLTLLIPSTLLKSSLVAQLSRYEKLKFKIALTNMKKIHTLFFKFQKIYSSNCFCKSKIFYFSDRRFNWSKFSV